MVLDPCSVHTHELVVPHCVVLDPDAGYYNIRVPLPMSITFSLLSFLVITVLQAVLLRPSNVV